MILASILPDPFAQLCGQPMGLPVGYFVEVVRDRLGPAAAGIFEQGDDEPAPPPAPARAAAPSAPPPAPAATPEPPKQEPTPVITTTTPDPKLRIMQTSNALSRAAEAAERARHVRTPAAELAARFDASPELQREFGGNRDAYVLYQQRHGERAAAERAERAALDAAIDAAAADPEMAWTGSATLRAAFGDDRPAYDAYFRHRDGRGVSFLAQR